MSRLYEIVNDVINASSLEEAIDFLYGTEGIHINSDEYFKNIVSNFIQKKEYVIKKRGNNLIFDLSNYNDIWNIVFLGEYIKENDTLYKVYNDLLREIENIKIELDKIKLKHKEASSKEEHLKINEEYKELDKKLALKEEEKKNYSGVIETFYETDWVRLENSTDEVEKIEAVELLKQSINIIHKLRNNLEHGIATIDRNIEINSDNFNVSIPIEYIDGFNKGRIIVKEEDKIVLEQTMNIASPLLESLGYDVKKVESFFYNVNPEWLSFLLEQVNYDYDELYKLSKFIFYCPKEVNYLLSNGLSFESVKELSNKVRYPEAVIKLHNEGFDVQKLADGAFLHPDEVSKLKNAGIDVYRYHCYNFSTEEVIKLYDREIDIYKLSLNKGCNSEEIIEMLNNGIDIYKLPVEGLKRSKNVYELHNAGIDIYKLPRESFLFPKAVIKLHKELNNRGMNIYDFPRAVLYYPDIAIDFIDRGIDIRNFPEEAFKFKTITMLFLITGIEISESLSLSAFLNYDSAIKLHSKGIDVNKIPDEAIENIDATLQFLDRSIDIYKLPKGAFKKPEVVYKLINDGIDITKLPDKGFVWNNLIAENYYDDEKYNDIQDYFCKTENVKYLLGLVNNDYTKLEQFPVEFFTCDISLIDDMYKTYNLNVARSVFGINNPKLIATLVYCNSVFKDYQKSNNDFDLIDLDPIRVIHSSFNDTYKYKDNITDMGINQETYLKQFILTEDGTARNYEDIKVNILDKLRNSTIHFRFKPVKDSDGNIVDNKVYLYDKYNELDTNNFNIIMDLKDLVEITRQIELGLEKKKIDYVEKESEVNRFNSIGKR
ncbi:MAG: hypothetical protein IJG97_01560 [Bacilli bacterium]|nr:hypothetical protein [Bacilli bacterium]